MAERRSLSSPRGSRGVSLGVLIANQLLAGIGVASGMAVAALLVQGLTGAVALAGLAQSVNVLGAAIAAVPLARLAIRAGRHVALAVGYGLAALGAALIIGAATSGWIPLVFLGLAAFGAGAAAGLQARFAATEIAAAGFEARAMSLVLWATTIGSVAGPLLSETGDSIGRALGLPPLVGPFLFSGAAFALSTVLVATLLRLPRAGTLATDRLPKPVEGNEPDASGPPATGSGSDPAEAAHIGSWQAFRSAIREPRALFAILAIVCSHTVMVGVMVMTPVHMTTHGLSLTLVGLVISVHIVGMYGASPFVGWLVDRIGPARVIAIGVVVLFIATFISILSPPDDMLLIPLALGLLGLGWSCGLIGGSTLLTTAVDPAHRVPLQGATDAAMNLSAAASAALSGVILSAVGFAGVNVVAALVLVPLVVAGLRARAVSRRVVTGLR